jgi:Tol biopolymer transport system component
MLGCSASLRRGLVTTEAATNLEQVTRSGENEFDPAVSPDGQTIAFEVARSPDAPPHVEGMALRDIHAPAPARIDFAPRGETERQPAWMPRGDGLVVLSGTDGRYRLAQTFGASLERTTFLADTGNPSLPATWPSVSPDGTRVAVALPRLDVFQTGWRSERYLPSALGVTDLFGSGITVLGEGTEPSWSPHGRRLAFSREVDGHAHLFVARADGTGTVQITDGAQDDVEPAWSPDGRSLVYCERDLTERGTTRSNLFVVSADGSGLKQLTEGDTQACRPDWAKDGYVYFHANATGRFHIWRLRLVVTSEATQGHVP